MDGGRSYYGGGGGGRQNHRSGGRHRRLGGGGGRGRGYRNQPYNNNNNNNRRGGGRGGGRGNRFGGQQTVDPQIQLLSQIASFVSRAGEFQNLRDSETPDLRSVEFTTASNINDLVPILCADDKLELLMKFQAEATKPEDKVGKLVHLVVSCAAALPLQTPCYAALTLGLHEQTKGTAGEGFAGRCLQYSMVQIARDLDTVLLMGQDQAKATCRLKLMVRYLAIMGTMGMVKSYEGEETIDPSRMTVFGLVSILVDAARAAAEQHSNMAAANVLVVLVLSTLPYLMESSVPRDVIMERFLKPIETFMETYKSTFAPGFGSSSLLLKEPQVEDDDDDDDEEEDGDDEEEEGSGQVCDSLQDLVRAAARWRRQGEISKFALPLDAPWKGLVRKSTPNPDSGETESHPITYSEEPLYLAFSHECQVLTLLLGTGGGGGDSSQQLKLQCFDLQGVVFGRLPIFGSPPDPEDADDDEEEMEGGAPKNEQLEAFKSSSLLDRYFVADTMRDCLMSHESVVNPTGLQLGSAKTAAEELLRVCHVFSGDNTSVGMEYAMVETIFALIAQASEYSSFRHTFLSRVLLELTRLEPSRLSQALAVAMTNLFQDYLPALVPCARENFSRWFAFHLINTDYQWPSAFWKVWEPYATSDKQSSRGAFVRRALNVMADNVSDPAPITTQCLSSVKSLTNELLARSNSKTWTDEDSPVESELHRRIWDNDEDPTLLQDYLVGEEVATALSGASSGWARTDVLIRVIVDPARQMHESFKSAIEKSDEGGDGDDDDAMAEDTALSKDVYAAVTGCIERYKQAIVASTNKDAEGQNGGEDKMIAGAAFLLQRIASVASFSSSLLEGIVVSLVKNGIVDALAVLRWVLSDLGDDSGSGVVSRWWIFASQAALETLSSLERDATAGGSIIVDGGGMDSDGEFSSKATKQMTHMLQYSVKRVCSLLVAGQGDDKRLNPMQVDLVEGMKTFALNGKMLLLSVLTSPAGMRKASLQDEVHELLTKSEMCGSALAGLCAGHEGSSAVNLLQRSLENL